MHYSTNFINRVVQQAHRVQAIAKVCDYLENPADFPQSPLIWFGSCQPSQLLVHINVVLQLKKNSPMTSKSIEQLENNVWEMPNEFPTDMIKRCFEYRKIGIAELTTEQIRLLISQEIGIEYLIGTAIEKLKRNILAEGDFYKGDLLVAVSKIPTRYWTENKNYELNFESIIKQNADLIKMELGEKEYERIQNAKSRKHNNV